MNTFHKYSDQRIPIVNRSCELERLRFFRLLRDSETAPFVDDDTSVGMEYEVQAAVAGASEDVDLPLTIAKSTYVKNVIKRSARGALPNETLQRLDAFLDNNPSQVWENSWERFPEQLPPQAGTRRRHRYRSASPQTAFLHRRKTPRPPAE